MMKVTIHVKAEHIANGIPKDLGHCMVALAIKDALGVPLVSCGETFFSTASSGTAEAFEFENTTLWNVVCTGLDTDTEVVKNIRAFDLGLPVQPFTFEMQEF